MPLEVDEEVVEDAVVLEGWSVVFVSVVAVVPEAWFVSVFVAVSAVVGAGTWHRSRVAEQTHYARVVS